jgi:hypothetical protein
VDATADAGEEFYNESVDEDVSLDLLLESVDDVCRPTGMSGIDFRGTAFDDFNSKLDASVFNTLPHTHHVRPTHTTSVLRKVFLPG